VVLQLACIDFLGFFIKSSMCHDQLMVVYERC